MQIGDKIKIVNYGHVLFTSKGEQHKEGVARMDKSFPRVGEDEAFYYHDIRPELVGKEGEVVNRVDRCNTPRYSILFDDGNRISWFAEEQLELV